MNFYKFKAENYRNIFALPVVQAISCSPMPMYIILGGLGGQSLASNVCYATLPISLCIVGSMVTSPIVSNLMQSTTRRLRLVVGNLAGLIGSLASLLGIFFGSFELFLFGSVVSGAYMGSQAFYRFAATDDCEDLFKARAISTVLSGGLIAAILGPSMVKISLSLDNSVPFLYSYLGLVILNCLGPFILSCIKSIPLSKSSGRNINDNSNKTNLIRPLVLFSKAR